MGKVIHGDCMDILKTLPDNSVDSVCCDPPYELSFMNKGWDSTGIANNSDMWREVLRVLKPGGHLLSFSGTRTYHRMATGIEDAGFEIRDMVEWVYGSGFPKSLNIGKAVDKTLGAEREKIIVTENFRNPKSINSGEGIEGGDRPWLVKARELGYHEKDSDIPATEEAKKWEGWGTALKPAHEPICLARKPLEKGMNVANNVLKYGTGGLNIDKSRVGTEERYNSFAGNKDTGFTADDDRTDAGKGLYAGNKDGGNTVQGRFPANLLHDGSDEVVREFPNESERFFKSFIYCPKASKSERDRGCEGMEATELRGGGGRANTGYDRNNPEEERLRKAATAYGAVKAVKSNNHPTVKPLALMKYLIQMITPEGGVVLDPFAGSGSTLVAAKELGYDFIGIEMTEEYIPIIEARLAAVKEVQQELL